MGPRQVSQEYREQQQRSLIGFGLYFKENGEPKSINVDLISETSLGQTGYEVCCAFKYFICF